VSVKEAIRMFAYKTGIKLISGKENIEIQALQKSINLLAKLEITEKAKRITFNAKEELIINGGGSYTKWSAGGIESGTSGGWVSHAASHSMPGPSAISLCSEPLVVHDLKGCAMQMQAATLSGSAGVEFE